MGLEKVHASPLFLRIELFVISIIEGKRKGKFILYILSLFYRYWQVMKQLFPKKAYRCQKPTFCIGNITAGGSGKTPFIEFLCELLSSKKKIAVLSRGYRSEAERSGKVIRIRENPAFLHPSKCGDEPYLLLKKFPSIECIIGKNRLEAAKKIENDVDMILLEGGLQSRKLFYHKKIIMLSAKNPWGNGYFLPRGYLRDHPRKLKKADLIVVHGIKDEILFQKLEKEISIWTSAPILGTYPRLIGIEGYAPKTNKVGIFCGIGDPQRFINDLEKHLGFDIVDIWKLADHEKASDKKLFSFSQRCKDKGAECLLCTEKDFVKIESSEKYILPLAYVNTKVELSFGKEHFSEFIKPFL